MWKTFQFYSLRIFWKDNVIVSNLLNIDLCKMLQGQARIPRDIGTWWNVFEELKFTTDNMLTLNFHARSMNGIIIVLGSIWLKKLCTFNLIRRSYGTRKQRNACKELCSIWNQTRSRTPTRIKEVQTLKLARFYVWEAQTLTRARAEGSCEAKDGDYE